MLEYVSRISNEYVCVCVCRVGWEWGVGWQDI